MNLITYDIQSTDMVAADKYIGGRQGVIGCSAHNFSFRRHSAVDVRVRYHTVRIQGNGNADRSPANVQTKKNACLIKFNASLKI